MDLIYQVPGAPKRISLSVLGSDPVGLDCNASAIKRTEAATLCVYILRRMEGMHSWAVALGVWKSVQPRVNHAQIYRQR